MNFKFFCKGTNSFFQYFLKLIITQGMFSPNNKIIVEISVTKLSGCLNLHMY